MSYKYRGHNRLFLCVLCIFVALTLSACQMKETELPFETIEQQEISNYQNTEPGLVVITKQAEVNNLDDWVLQEVRSRLQTIDYNAYVVIAVFQGWKPTTRYGVQIERITRKGSIISIHALFLESKPGEPTGDLATSPYHLVRVQKTGTWGQQISFNLVVHGATVTSLSHYVP